MPDAMAPTPTSDSANVCWISGATADSATATRLAAAIAANDSASPCAVRRRPAERPAAARPASGGVGARAAVPAGASAGSGPLSTGSVATPQADGTWRPCPGFATIEPLSKTRLSPHEGLHRPAGERLALVQRVARRAVQAPGVDRAGLRRVEDDHVGVRADGQLPLLRVQVEPAGGVLAQHPGQVLDGGSARSAHRRCARPTARCPCPARAPPGRPRSRRRCASCAGTSGSRCRCWSSCRPGPPSRARPGRGRAGSAAGSCRRRPCRVASASGAVQYRKAARVSPNTGQPLSLRSRISSTLCQALVCTTYTGVPTSCAISAAG